MAQIDVINIKKVEKQRNTIHEKVVTTYTTFENEGCRYLQFDTYGKNDREMPEKISQSIQFDKASAKYVINLLLKEFSMSYQDFLEE